MHLELQNLHIVGWCIQWAFLVCGFVYHSFIFHGTTVTTLVHPIVGPLFICGRACVVLTCCMSSRMT
jgi:hypothetical protein